MLYFQIQSGCISFGDTLSYYPFMAIFLGVIWLIRAFIMFKVSRRLAILEQSGANTAVVTTVAPASAVVIAVAQPVDHANTNSYENERVPLSSANTSKGNIGYQSFDGEGGHVV